MKGLWEKKNNANLYPQITYTIDLFKFIRYELLILKEITLVIKLCE